jgi:hypothetical protein
VSKALARDLAIGRRLHTQGPTARDTRPTRVHTPTSACNRTIVCSKRFASMRRAVGARPEASEPAKP